MARNTKGEKLTDQERHERFVDMAKEVKASEDPKDFEKAFDRISKLGHSDHQRKSSK